MNDEWSGLPGDSEPPRPMPAWIPKSLAWSAFGMVLSLGLCGASLGMGPGAGFRDLAIYPGILGLFGFLTCLCTTLLSGALVFVYLILGRR